MKRTLYAHVKIGTGWLSLAAIPFEDQYRLGYAWCAPADQFSRAKGRTIADGRARCERTAIAIRLDSPRDLVRVARDELFGSRALPRWVEAVDWLDFASLTAA